LRDEVDLEAAEWRITAERMKMRAPHIVPLSREAVETFAELRSIAGRSDDRLYGFAHSTCQPFEPACANR
jgi:integrase